MKICGLQKTTLLDFPGHVAATVFTGGCNFRCPFCHNSELLPGTVEAEYETGEVLDFLRKRKGILEGVCITGGEPTLQPDLEDFIRSVRELGLLVKLDTNGYDPIQLDHLFKEGLVDYIAMDIKNSQEKYAKTVGRTDLDLTRIKLSVDLIRDSGLDYEFRTTVVRELHSIDDMYEIARWLEGSMAYYIQSYVASEDVIMPIFSSYSKDELLAMQALMKDYIPRVFLRGVD